MVLGSNPQLSRAEVLNFCDEILFDEQKSLLLAENLVFTNPRNLPKTPEQIFLDKLGGTVRMAKVVGEFREKKKMVQTIFELSERAETAQNIKLGVSSFGTGKSFLPDFFKLLKKYFAEKKENLRIENHGGKNLTSGEIFDRKLLKKGLEFIIWQRGNSFLLCQTVANQNLRNYTLRDRRKVFSDSKMGMLPPKLAQILINLAMAGLDQKTTVIDPFCGSGTVCTEAAIMGFKTVGSDLNPDFLAGSKKNFQFFAEKFRYLPTEGKFLTENAEIFPWAKYSQAVMATEGWLGENFTRTPNLDQIEQQAVKVLKMWQKVFKNLEKSGPQKIALCLPCWNFRGKKISISQKLFAKINKNLYTPLALFDKQKTFVYQREKAFVAREICVLVRNS